MVVIIKIRHVPEDPRGYDIKTFETEREGKKKKKNNSESKMREMAE